MSAMGLKRTPHQIRAEAYPYDATEYVALEIFLMERARGMLFEAPGVRP